MRPTDEIRIISARALLEADLPETSWVIPDVLPQGLAILVSKSKMGKSWLAMAFGVGVAHGGACLGSLPTVRGEVLYADLENPPRRTRQRLIRTLDVGGDCPTGLYFTNEWPAMDRGALDRLREWVHAHPETKLVIIDTVAKVWPAKLGGPGINAYYAEYQLLSQFKDLADEHGLSLLLLHHEKKGAEDDDLDSISGSAAFAAAPDVILKLKRRRGQNRSTLYVTGREGSEKKYLLRFNLQAGSFQLMSELDPGGDDDGESGEFNSAAPAAAWYGTD